MKKIRVFHVDAFTNKSFGGNTAGVVPEAAELTEQEMQNIARELNQSETAFVLPATSQEADVRVRYFTPSSEIDFCGHATVGLSWIMAKEYGWMNKADEIKLETNIGIVPVKWALNAGKLEAVVMTQVPPKVKELNVNLNEITRLIGLDEKDLDQSLPIKLAFTGNWHLLIPVKTRAAVDSAKPLIDELGHFNREHQISTTHLFTFDPAEENHKIYTRDFAPAVGIKEDPVTGSANGALAGYLVLEHILEPKEHHHFKIGQGHSIGRPGELEIFISPGKEGPIIQVGGRAVSTISGELRF